MARLSRTASRRQTVERVLAAADAVFTERGYAAASLREIADRAGFTKGAIYGNFASKEDLFVAVQQRRNTAWGDDMRAEVGRASSLDGLLAAVGRWHDAWQQLNVSNIRNSGEFWLLAERNDVLRPLIADTFRSGTRETSEFIAHQADRFDLDPPISHDEAAQLLIAVVYGIQTRARFDPDVPGGRLLQLATALVLGAPVDGADHPSGRRDPRR